MKIYLQGPAPDPTLSHFANFSPNYTVFRQISPFCAKFRCFSPIFCQFGVWRGKRKFIVKLECQPKSPNCYSLDYYFWDVLKTDIYQKRSRPCANLDQLKRRIRSVWQRAINIEHIKKVILRYRSHLKHVRRAEGGAIEEHFG